MNVPALRPGRLSRDPRRSRRLRHQPAPKKADLRDKEKELAPKTQPESSPARAMADPARVKPISAAAVGGPSLHCQPDSIKDEPPDHVPQGLDEALGTPRRRSRSSHIVVTKESTKARKSTKENVKAQRSKPGRSTRDYFSSRSTSMSNNALMFSATNSLSLWYRRSICFMRL